ncbi:hypothetical protein [Helicobacter enhydrae]
MECFCIGVVVSKGVKCAMLGINGDLVNTKVEIDRKDGKNEKA